MNNLHRQQNLQPKITFLFISTNFNFTLMFSKTINLNFIKKKKKLSN